MSKIILLEPDVRLGKILQEFLETKHGHEIMRSNSAQTALHLIDDNQPDLIITELQLTAHNGIEFLYELRSYDDWKSIPVIIHSHVTPLQTSISPMLWQELNIAGYYYKPSTKLLDLALAVDNVLVSV